MYSKPIIYLSSLKPWYWAIYNYRSTLNNRSTLNTLKNPNILNTPIFGRGGRIREYYLELTSK